MVALFLFIVFGLFFGYFATQNTALVEIHLGTFSLQHVPMYILIISSFAVGVIFTSLFCFVKYIPLQLAARKKEHELEESEKKTAEFLKKIHQLEIDIEKLELETGKKLDDEESI